MDRARIRATRLVATLAAACLFAAADTRCIADDYAEVDFVPRVRAALSRFATYGDIAGAGGASAANNWPGSINPASIEWLDPFGPLGIIVSPQYSSISFSEGTELDICIGAINIDVGDWGTIQPAVARIRSNRRTARNGLDFRYDMDLFQIQWAKYQANNWALGVNFNFAFTEMRYDFGHIQVSKAAFETYGVRVGALAQAGERLLIGAILDYAASPSHTVTYWPFSLAEGDLKVTDTTHQFYLRPGLSYEYSKGSTAYLDYQYGQFWNDLSTLEVHRAYVGIDHRICEWLFLRGGATLDDRGHVAWTAGVGIHPPGLFKLDVGYQDDMFPELAPELGHSKVLTVSLGLGF